MTTVVSNSAALVPAWSGSQRSAETHHHLLPFFSGLPCLVKIVHCPDGLRMNAVTSSIEWKEMVCGTRFTQYVAHIGNVKFHLKWCWMKLWVGKLPGYSIHILVVVFISCLLSIFIRDFCMLWEPEVRFKSPPLAGGMICHLFNVHKTKNTVLYGSGEKNNFNVSFQK